MKKSELRKIIQEEIQNILEVERIHIVSKDVVPFKNWMDKELWIKKSNIMVQDWVDEKTGKVTQKKATLKQVYDLFKKQKK